MTARSLSRGGLEARALPLTAAPLVPKDPVEPVAVLAPPPALKHCARPPREPPEGGSNDSPLNA